MKKFVNYFVFLCLFFLDVFSDDYSNFVRGCRNGNVNVSNVSDCYCKALDETKKQIEFNKKALSNLSETSGFCDGEEEDFYTTELKLYSARLQILSYEGMQEANFISHECLNRLSEANILETKENLFRQVGIDLTILKY